MEMRGATAPHAWVLPIGHYFGIHDYFIVEPDERDVGEFVEKMIANRPGQALPLFGLDLLGEGEVMLVDKLVLKVMARTLTEIGNADPILHGPPRDNIGPDAALGVFVSKHVA